jgi:hypothetical protein
MPATPTSIPNQEDIMVWHEYPGCAAIFAGIHGWLR